MRLVFINRFYWPNESATAQLLHDLATFLAKRGHNVTVLTSNGPPSFCATREHVDNVLIARVSCHSAGNGLVRKAWEFATFMAGVVWALAWHSRRGDTVVAMTDPPLLGVIVDLVCELRGARLIHWTQDIYPEVILRQKVFAPLRFASVLARPARDGAWHRAAACVVISHEMAVLLRQRGVASSNVAVIPNWAPAGLTYQPPEASASLREDWGLAGRFVVAYSGNLGRVHDLEAIVDLAAALKDDPNIKLLIVGRGPGQNGLAAAVAARGIKNVQFQPLQPRERLAASLAVADIHLVTLREGYEGLVFPSKVYGIARVGRALAFIGPRSSELARLIFHHRMGIAVTRTEIPQLAATLRQWAADGSAAELGRAAATFGQDYAKAEYGCEAWENLLHAH